ncbi:MAG: cysteine hydrolase [Acidobacteriales bacterium]|nr:cysteine hydrolase [Terriglobales bacterium]
MSVDSAAIQPGKNQDLHGNAPDRCGAALLLIDVLNDLDFPDNEELVRNAAGLSRRLVELKRRCRAAGIPVIYVNDNRGRWRSNLADVLECCTRPGVPGRQLSQSLAPDDDDYVVLKPKHSGFYATPLETLLQYIGARSVIIAGLTSNTCVLITVSDAFIRDFHVYVPCDCVAALNESDQRTALAMMRDNFYVDTSPSDRLNFEEVLSPRSKE